MPEYTVYTVYLAQWKNDKGHWIDYSHDQPTDEGLINESGR